jgi:hypothetical protein
MPATPLWLAARAFARERSLPEAGGAVMKRYRACGGRIEAGMVRAQIAEAQRLDDGAGEAIGDAVGGAQARPADLLRRGANLSCLDYTGLALMASAL